MSAYVLFNLSNEFGKKDKMRGLSKILSFLVTILFLSPIFSKKGEHT